MRVNPISRFLPPFVQKQTFIGSAQKELGSGVDILRKIGMSSDLITQIVKLLTGAFEFVEKTEPDQPLWRSSTELLPHIHKMVNHFLYAEAESLLKELRVKLLKRSGFVDDPGNLDVGDIERKFDSARNMSWAYDMEEALPSQDEFAAILPNSINYIEQGKVRPLQNKGPYLIVPDTLSQEY